MPLFLIFIIIPLIEITVFVTVGEELGLGKTLLLCFLTAVLGAFFVQKQGLETIEKVQTRLNTGAMPTKEIYEGMCIMIAGITLITPGFFTDIIGFSLLTPFIRDAIFRYIEKKTIAKKGHHPGFTSPDIIDGEFEDITGQSDPDQDKLQ